MRLTIPCLLLFFTISSCSKYQYVQLSSSTAIQTGENRFETASDSFRVEYSFSGEKGLAQIAVYNLSASVMSIDWEKSFFINDGKAESLYKPSNTITGAITRTGYTTEDFNAELNKKDNPLQFIPPKAQITKSLLPVIRTGYNTEVAEKKKYTMAESPQTFRLYISLDGEKLGNFHPVDNAFYISALANRATGSQSQPDLATANPVLVSRSTTGRRIANASGVMLGVALIVVGLANNPAN